MLFFISPHHAGSIDYWMATVEKEVKDMVVSKHSTHVKEMERVIKGDDDCSRVCLAVFMVFVASLKVLEQCLLIFIFSSNANTIIT